jgi:hypothetical protein
MWSDNKVRELIAVKVLHTSLLNITVVRIGGWVNPSAGLEDVGKRKFLILQGTELRFLGRPARSQSLYRQRYPGSFGKHNME